MQQWLSGAGGEGSAVPSGAQLEVFTTRPDTLFGATYMVVAPEHPLLEGLTSVQQRAAVQEYIQKAALKSDLERTELQKVKSGVFTGDHPMMGFFRHLASFDATGESSQGLLLWHAGSFALNPATREAVPIWVADYVLGSYGSGAIMAVPAHDARDFEFAQQYGLPVVRVVQDDAEEDAELPFTGL